MDVKRYANTTDIDFEIEFVTPTFLGGADGNAEIRTAPFKTVLRYWWRVLFGKKYMSQLKQKEDEIFGSTEMASKVRLQIVSTSNVNINKNNFQKFSMQHNYGSHLIQINILDYLAYGKHEYVKGQGNVYAYSHIEPSAKIKFSLSKRLSEEHAYEVKDAIKAFVMFGGVGSRARNGYGSIYCEEIENWSWNNKIQCDSCLAEFPVISKEIRLYETKESFGTWEEALARIGKNYIEARLSLENPHHFERRAFLAKPIISKQDKFNIPKDVQKDRLPKNLYLHVKKTDADKFVGQILIIPVQHKKEQQQYIAVIKDMESKFKNNMNDKTNDLFQKLGGTAK